MRKLFSKFFTREFIDIIFIPIIAALSSYIVSVVQDTLSFGDVLLIFIAVLILISVMHVIALKTTTRNIDNLLRDRAYEICKEAYQRAKNELDSSVCEISAHAISKYGEKRKENELLGEKFFSIEKLREIESSGVWGRQKISSIWCLTSTIKYLATDFSDAVQENLSRGIKYTYFYEDNQDNADYLQIAEKMFGSAVAYIKIPPEQFWILVDDFDFTVYNLEKNASDEISQICVMSTAAYIEGSPYHVIASSALAHRISRVLTSLQENYVNGFA